MIALLDTTVLVASLIPDEPDHAACDALISRRSSVIYLHALNETFATLTGGRLGVKIDPDVAARLIEESILPLVSVVELNAAEVTKAQHAARARGVRGGAVYDYMHLVAARKVRAETLFALNEEDFRAVRRSGDPVVKRPADA